MRHLNVARPLALYFVVFVVCLSQSAISCGGGDQRMKAVNVAMISVDAARDGFMAWTKEHQQSIIDKATSKAEAEQKLSAYVAERDKIKDGFEVVYAALKVAASKTDDASLQAALVAATDLYARVKAFTALFGKPEPAAASTPPSDGGL